MPQDAPDPIAEALARPLFEATPPNTLRLGLVLNGTVAAGAWTAGALDALVEALDVWEAAKNDGLDVPRHAVRLEMAGGASGGAVCAALLARVSGAVLPHARHDAPPPRGNPLWDVWVEDLDIGDMLEVETLAAAGLPPDSLLSGRAIARAMERILSWQGVPLAAPRPWLAEPFRVLVTQTNLRGIPHELTLRPDGQGLPRRTQYVAHADHVAFVVGRGAAARGDEFPIDPDAPADWKRLALHARASGAFPVGFPPVRLDRPAAHYEWRGVMLPAGGGQGARLRRLRPAWTDPALAAPGAVYAYDAVDGGALNNSPFQLVHDRMTGLGGSFARGGAEGALLVVDPFLAQSPAALPEAAPGLGGVVGGLLGAWLAHSRYSSSEVPLASDAAVASRHLFTAGRKRRDGTAAWGADALTTSGLSAFLGFLDRRLRAHDYMLGRRNMLGWLQRHFVLPADSALFQGAVSDNARADHVVAGQEGPMLPIIPLLPPLRALPPQPDWPDVVPARGLPGDIRGRLRGVLNGLLGRDGLVEIAAQLGAGRGSAVAMRLVEAAMDELRARG